MLYSVHASGWLFLAVVCCTAAVAGTDGSSPGVFREMLKAAAKECDQTFHDEHGKRSFPDVAEGQWTVLDEGKKFFAGECHVGKAEGTWTVFHDHGAKAVEARFHEGKAEGLWRYWHYNGRLIIEEEYQHGLKNGRVTKWSKYNGVKWLSGTYKDGKMDGTWTFWNDDGKLDREEIWKDDVRISP